MSDNLLGYSNSGFSQSLNGIDSISDGGGASISNGNAIFLDTNTNTITVNNVLTIPVSSLIYLYGGIYLPVSSTVPVATTITADMMYLMYTQNTNSNILLTGATYNSSTSTLNFSNNVSIGSTSGLASQSYFTINSKGTIILNGSINLPTSGNSIGQTQLNYLTNVTSDIQAQFNAINVSAYQPLITSSVSFNANNIQCNGNLSVYSYNGSTNTMTITTGYYNGAYSPGDVQFQIPGGRFYFAQEMLINGPLTCTGNINGTVTNANNILVSNNSGLNQNYYITFSGAYNSITSLICTGYLYFNTSTNILTLTTGSINAPSFSGNLTGNVTGNVSGNATTATTASSCSGNSATATTATTASSCSGNSATATIATNVNLTAVSGSSNFYIPFSSSATGSQALKTTTNLYWNNTSGTLSTTNYFCSGTITTASLTTSGINGVYASFYDPTSSIQTQFNNVYSGNNTFSGNCSFSNTLSTFSGTSTNANNIKITGGNVTNASYYLTCVNNANSSTAGNYSPITGNLYFNPSTSTLITTTFSGALNGNATTASSCSGNSATATTASSCSGNSATCTTATNVNLSGSANVNINYFIPFGVNASGSTPLLINGCIYFNPLYQTLSCTAFTGSLNGNATSASSCSGNSTTATSASNVVVANNTGLNANYYIPFTAGNVGTYPLLTTTFLYFNTSTNILSLTTGTINAPSFVGTLTGVATSANTATVANNLNLVSVGTNQNFQVLFSLYTNTSAAIYTSSNNYGLSFNPNKNVLSTCGLTVGNGATASTIGTTSGDTLTINSTLTVNTAITQNNTTAPTSFSQLGYVNSYSNTTSGASGTYNIQITGTSGILTTSAQYGCYYLNVSFNIKAFTSTSYTLVSIGTSSTANPSCCTMMSYSEQFNSVTSTYSTLSYPFMFYSTSTSIYIVIQNNNANNSVYVNYSLMRIA